MKRLLRAPVRTIRRRDLRVTALMTLSGCLTSATVVDSRYYDVPPGTRRPARVSGSVTVVHDESVVPLDDALVPTQAARAVKVLDSGDRERGEELVAEAVSGTTEREAAQAFRELLVDLKGLPSADHAWRVATVEAVLPELAGTSFEAKARAFLRREENAYLARAYVELCRTAARKATPDDRAACLTAELPSFEGTRYESKIEAMIEKERAKSARLADHGVGADAALELSSEEPGEGIEAAPPAPQVHVTRRARAGGRLLSAGPRVGMVAVTGDLLLSLEYEHDATSPLSVWGWQFEYQHEGDPAGATGLVEFVPMVAGLEQGLDFYSLSVFAGMRTRGGTEFVLGPYFSPNGVGMGVAVGHTFRKGELSLPVNFAVTRNNHGERYSLTFGWNLRQ